MSKDIICCQVERISQTNEKVLNKETYISITDFCEGLDDSVKNSVNGLTEFWTE